MEQQRIDNLQRIKRYIFWIDKDIKSEENQNYLEYLHKEFSSYEIESFDSIENFESFLKDKRDKYDFKFMYTIVGGNLADDFFNFYNSLSHINFISATIIFCENISLHSSKPYANDLYLNPGGIVSTFEEVIEYINNPNDKLWHQLGSIKQIVFFFLKIQIVPGINLDRLKIYQK